MLSRLIISTYIYFLIWLGRYKKAEVICREDIKRYPKSLSSHNLLGIIYKKQGELSKAVGEYRLLLELSSDEPSNYIDFISVLFESKNYKEVTKYGNAFFQKKFSGLRKLLKSSLIDSMYWYLAYAYYYEKNYSEALSYFNKLIVLNIKDKNQYFSIIAECYQLTGNYNKSIEYAEKALPFSVDKKQKALIYNILGHSYWNLKNIKKAIENFEMVLKFDNNLRETQYNLGVIYNDIKEYGKAEEHMEIAVQVYPNDIECLLFLGNLYAKKNKYNDALRIYRNALKLEPENEKIKFAIDNVQSELWKSE